MIELRNITRRFGGLTVYDDFSLAIEEGKIACVLGASGCGKTTLLNMMAGVLSFSGTIEPMQPCSYIFQQPRLVPNLTVFGNLRLICRDAARVRDMLARVGLSEKADSYPVELSGGQAQRVSIARAFLHPSRLLLMDEPFSSLDTALKIRLMRLFADIWQEERRTVLFVTHDVEEAYMLAHRAIVLRGGKIAADIDCGGGTLPRPYGEGGAAIKNALLEALLEGEEE